MLDQVLAAVRADPRVVVVSPDSSVERLRYRPRDADAVYTGPRSCASSPPRHDSVPEYTAPDIIVAPREPILTTEELNRFSQTLAPGTLAEDRTYACDIPNTRPFGNLVCDKIAFGTFRYTDRLGSVITVTTRATETEARIEAYDALEAIPEGFERWPTVALRQERTEERLETKSRDIIGHFRLRCYPAAAVADWFLQHGPADNQISRSELNHLLRGD